MQEQATKGSVHTILAPTGWLQPRGYVDGMVGVGRHVLTSGIIGWDREHRLADTFVDQARQTFQNIADILAEASAGPEHLVRLSWFVTSMAEYAADPRGLGRAYRDVFGRIYPTMAVVEVVRLLEPAAKLEIQATAVVPD